MAYKNYYTVLGVPNFSSMDVLKKAYRQKVKECHPDVGGDPATFKEVQNAWEHMSSSPTYKENYDKQLRAQLEGTSSNTYRARARTHGNSRRHPVCSACGSYVCHTVLPGGYPCGAMTKCGTCGSVLCEEVIGPYGHRCRANTQPVCRECNSPMCENVMGPLGYRCHKRCSGCGSSRCKTVGGPIDCPKQSKGCSRCGAWTCKGCSCSACGSPTCTDPDCGKADNFWEQHKQFILLNALYVTAMIGTVLWALS